MKKDLLVVLIAAIALFNAACEKPQEARTKQPAAPLANVDIIKVSRSSSSETYEATGTVKAKTTTEVSSNVLGRITSIPVNEGDIVGRGSILVELDDRDAQARMEKASAGLREAQASLIELNNSTAASEAAVKTVVANKELAEVTFARYEELYRRRSVSGQEYDEARSRLNLALSELERSKASLNTVISKKAQLDARIDQARAEIANSKIQANYSRIVAPVSGVIVKKFVEAGATAAPGVPLLAIEDNSQYLLEVTVPESHSKMVRLSDRLNVQIDALGADRITGTVREILPTLDAASRSLTVKIELPANSLLRTGLYGRAQFLLAQRDEMSLPRAAIIQRGQLSGIYIVGPDGTVRFRIVTTGKTTDDMVEVLSGVDVGDEVAGSGLGRLLDGAKVR